MQTVSRPASKSSLWRGAVTCTLLTSVVSLAACGSKPPREGRIETLEALNAYDEQRQGAAVGRQSLVAGHVYLLAPVPGAHVALWAVDGQSGTRLQRLAETHTLNDGSFALDAGTYEGPALLEAKAPAELAVLALPLREVGLGAALTEVTLTPVTTLMAAFAGFRAGTGLGWQRAVVEAEASLNAHFFAIDHTRIVPAPWPSDAGQSGRTCDLDQPARRASLVARGLAVLAGARLTRSASPQPDEEALGKLLAFVARDVAADGLVDGRPAEHGAGGPYVQVATEVLRDGLAGAIVAFLDGPSNHSGCRSSDAQSLLDHLQRSNHPPLLTRDVEPPAPLPPMPPPPEVTCVGKDEAGESLALDEVLSGPVTLHCRWQATGGASNLRFDAGTEAAWVRRVPVTTQGEVTLQIDTVEIEQHTHRNLSVVTLCADDAYGQSLCKDVTLRFRNCAPALQIFRADGRPFTAEDNVAWYAPGQGYAVRATFGEGTSKLQLFVDDKLQAEKEVTPGGEQSYYLAAMPEGCDEERKLILVAVDEAGHSSRRTASLRCLSRPPTLQPLPTLYGPDFTVANPATGNEGWSEHQVPTLHKLFNRLDYAPSLGADIHRQNLPVLYFSVDGADPKQLAGAPKVTYSYHKVIDTRGGSAPANREWRELFPAEDGSYSLPISYQTLLPQALLASGPLEVRAHNTLAQRSPDDVHEIVVRVENKAGFWQERPYRFRLDLRAPEVRLHSFELSPWVGKLRYEEVVEGLKSGTDIVTAKAEWSLGCTKDTLFPCHELKLKGKMWFQVDAGTMYIDQWDTGSGEMVIYNRPCGRQNLIDGDTTTNVAWSPLRGCHAPIKGGYATNRRSFLYMDAKDFWPPQQLVKSASRDIGIRLVDSEVQDLRFDFDLAVGAKDWRLTGGREGCFSLYHVTSEHELHYRSSLMHLLSTDYFVAGLVASATVPLSHQFAIEVPPDAPVPLSIVVANEGGQLALGWARSAGKPCRGQWDPRSEELGRMHHYDP